MYRNSTIVSTDPHNLTPDNHIVQNLGQTNILERNTSDQICLVNSNGTIVSTAPHTSMPNNDIISNPGQTEILSNILETNSSTQIENQLVRNNLIPEQIPLDLMERRIIEMKQEPIDSTENFQPHIDIREALLLRQQSSVSITPHNSIANNNSRVLNIKQETNLRTTLGETNSTDQINLTYRNSTTVSTAPHTYIPNNDIISNPRQIDIFSSSLERNNSDQIGLVSSNSTILSTTPMMIPWPSMSQYNGNHQIQHQLIDSNLRPEPVPLNVVQNGFIKMEQEPIVDSTENVQPQIHIREALLLRQQSSVSITPHNSIANNNSRVLNIKQETNLRTTLGETNSTDQINLTYRNSTTVSTAPHTYIPNNDIISNPRQIDIFSSSLERNNSDQIGLVSSNSTILSTTPMMIPWPSMSQYNGNHQIQHQNVDSNLFPEPVPLQIVQDRIIEMQEDRYFYTTVRDQIRREINVYQSCLMRQQSSVSIAPHNSIASTVSQNAMANNCQIQTIKQEENLSRNVREQNSSDQVDSVNSNESTLATRPRDLMAEQNPISIANNNIVSSIVRETPYFCIRKLPNIKNRFCNDDNDQTSQNDVIFICRICKSSPSTDIHSFALHMSDHKECNMHECVVCDKKFSSVVLWTEHMTYHQQQIDLNVSTVQFSPIETDSNTLDPINSENTEPQDFRNLRSRKCKISVLDDLHSDIIRVNSTKKMKYQYDCRICKQIFHSKSALQVHQTLHKKSQPFSCRYCDKTFSRKGPCTNHEKSHINSEKLLLQNNDNIKPKPTTIQNSTSIQDKNIDPETISIKQKNKIKSSSIKKTNFCNLCNRKFTKRCYFTNHMMVKHNINPNTPEQQLASIDCNKSTMLSENIELTDEYENKLSVTINKKNNNLNNHVNKSNEKKSTFCMLCNKQFGHLGALTNHMRIHSDKPYKCQYCYMQFSRKSPYITHEKKHVVKSAHSQNKNTIVVEVNDEPQIEHCNDFEFVHSPVDGNSSGTNLMGIEHLWFPCDVCEKKFSTPMQLHDHRKSHSGIVPYVCKICDGSYQLKFQWNRHLKGHYIKHKANLKNKQHTNK